MVCELTKTKHVQKNWRIRRYTTGTFRSLQMKQLLQKFVKYWSSLLLACLVTMLLYKCVIVLSFISFVSTRNRREDWGSGRTLTTIIRVLHVLVSITG